MKKDRPSRILVVEDHQDMQQILKRYLEEQEYTVEIADTAEIGLELFDSNRPDIILMDIQMPVMDGLEATRRIIDEHPNTRPRIIAMTANAMQGDRDMCLDAGMDDYIAKPIRVDRLTEALLNVPSPQKDQA